MTTPMLMTFLIFVTFRSSLSNSIIESPMLAMFALHSRCPISVFTFTPDMVIQFPCPSCSSHGLPLPRYCVQLIPVDLLCVYPAARCCHDLHLLAFPLAKRGNPMFSELSRACINVLLLREPTWKARCLPCSFYHLN